MKQQRNTTYRAWTWALILTAGLGLGLVRGTRRTQAALPPPPPNTRVVTNTTDNDPGSLRQTIAAAQSGDTITFQLSYPAVITLTTGELVINKTLTIQGPGAKLLTVSGNQMSRVFNISGGVTVTIDALTIANGKVSSSSSVEGGGIYNSGTLNLTHCVVTGNSLGTDGSKSGGGIFTTGTLTLSNRMVTNNSSGISNGGSSNGGGIYQNGGMVELLQTTVAGNAGTASGSAYGGGIYTTGGTMRMTNSTISGNALFSASGRDGGGIYNAGSTISATNCTITGNQALGSSSDRGGGVFGSITARNTIIAGNGARYGPDVYGTLNSLGYNLLGNNSDATITPTTGDQIGGGSNPPIDPQLAPLGNYGGPTQTHRPLPGSPAINTGNDALALDPDNNPLTTDQRGSARISGSRVDIGAVEIFQDAGAMSMIQLMVDPAMNPSGAAQELVSAIIFANEDPALTTIKLQCGTYSYSEAHNWEFGPNALPIIRSPITIEGNGAVLDSTNPVRLRFFYVAGNGVGGLSTGTLTLQNLTLQNGKQKGGDSQYGGGGAGMGGAIFNHGNVTLERVTLTGNRATGGNIVANASKGGGGMGQDAQNNYGGGFGGTPTGTGGKGGLGSTDNGGGGGGFLPMGSDGGPASGNAGAGGGMGLLGGKGGRQLGSATGDGGGGGDGYGNAGVGGVGGGFGYSGGLGSSNGGGGGGIGGGGLGFFGGGGGGGGFGGGGGSGETGSSGGGAGGGFGGGGGGNTVGNSNGGGGGFGGGSGVGGGVGGGGGGGGLGGAIFNHQGTLTLINCTLTANTAQGGGATFSGSVAVNGGSGFGSALFNLNGSVTLTSSTLAANTVLAGAAGTGSPNGTPGAANGGAIYNLAYGNDFTNGGTTTAHVILRNSILANSTGGSDLVNDQRDSTTTPAIGAGDNTATVDYSGPNIVMTKAHFSGTSLSDMISSANPNLGALQTNDCKPAVLPLQAGSPAINAATPDANVTSDQLGVLRQGNAPDLGAYEFTATPTITPSAPLSVNAGASLTAAPLATVSDADQARTTLTVTATLQPGNGSGVTLGTISVDSSGNVTANVMADCSATTSTFTLKVTDNGNLFEVKPLTITVTPDATRPDTNITGMPASVSDVNVSFTFSGTDNCPTNLTFQCKLDNGGWMPCSSGQSYTNLSFGQHTFSVKARDAAGNEDNSLASYTWTVFAASCGTVVNPATMPAATRGVQFVQTLSAQPTGSYVFSLLGGQLPPGISLVNTLGIYSLRGIPTTAGGYTFTIRAKKNNSTCEGARTYTINVP